jgi:2-C-methyl-D-erythritol 4-phosphate cytidylyltransferase
VLIHDGARPWVSPSLIENIIEEVKKHGAVIPLLPITDTPKECDAPLREYKQDGETQAVLITRHLKRANTGIAQTPQAFKFPEILRAHEKAAEVEDEEFTDDAEIWGRFCGSVAIIPGSPENRKITFPEDISR